MKYFLDSIVMKLCSHLYISFYPNFELVGGEQ